MIVRTVQPTVVQIPGASVTPNTVNVILHFFSSTYKNVYHYTCSEQETPGN